MVNNILETNRNFIDPNAEPEVSIVMPCLNESKTLPVCIRKAQEAIAQLRIPGEVVIADNGSTDGSQDLARSLGARVVDVPVRGYGAALRWGIQAAKGRYIVMGDSDDSYDFREAVHLVEKLMLGYNFCIGSRLRGRIMPGAMPWKNRHLGTPVLTWLVNLLYPAKFSDVNSGMRAFTKNAFNRMKLESDGMEFASEMLVKAAVLGLRVTEVPITLHKDGRDRAPHLRPWIDGWRHLKYIMLFAPKYIYWLPGALLFLMGTLLTLVLNLSPSGEFVYFGNLRFNDHWIVVAALFCLLGYELILTGVLAHLYMLTHRLQQRSHRMDKLVNSINIERIILLAAAMIVGGLIFEFSVIEVWLKSNFGPISGIRAAVTGMVLILMGAQTLFSGFFYAVLVDKYGKQSPPPDWSTTTESKPS